MNMKLLMPPDARKFFLLAIPFVVGNLIVARTLPVLNQFLFLDMWATATASILGGPWYGAIIGCLTNLTGDVFFGGQYLNYAPVSVWGAIIWGALAHRWGLGPFIPPEHKPNLYRQLTIRILVNGLVVGVVCMLLVMVILDDFSGSITLPPADTAAKEHPAVLMLRIFYDYFEKVGLAEYGLIDTARSRMSDLLTLPMHLVMTIPDKVFSASLAFYIAICIARKSGYAEWRLAGRKPSLHPIFSPVVFVCIYPAFLAAHVAINHPGFGVEKLPHYCLWLSPLLAAAPALRSALRGSAAGGRKKRSVDDHPGAYRKLTDTMDLLHYDLFDLYAVGYAIALFTVFAQFTDNGVVVAIKEVFERGIGVVTLLLLLKVLPVFVSHLLHDS